METDSQKSIKDIIDQVKAINKATSSLKNEIKKSLSERDQKYFEFQEKINQVKSNKDVTTGVLEQRILDTLEEIANAGPATDSESIKRENDQIELLRELIKDVEDPENKKLLKQQIREASKLHSQNSEIFTRTVDFLKNQFDSLGGVMAGVFADSPIIGIATSMLGSMIRESLERKKQRKLEKARILKERKEELDRKKEEMSILLQQLEEMKQSDEDELKPEIIDLKDEVSVTNNILDGIADSLDDGTAQAKKDEEFRREQNAKWDKLVDTLEKGKASGKKPPTEEEDEAFSITALKVKLLDILGRWTSGLFRGLASVAMAIPTTIAAAASNGLKILGRTLFVALPKTLFRLIPPIFIVTTLFSGLDDALRTYRDTGEFSKAVASFMGGIVEFVSFGLVKKEDVEKASESARTSLTDFFEWIFSEEGIPKIWKSIKNSFSSFGGSIVKTAKDNINEIITLIDDIFDLSPVKKQIESIRTTISDWFKGIANFFRDFDIEKKINELLPDFLKSEKDKKEVQSQEPEEVKEKKKGFFSRLFSSDDEDKIDEQPIEEQKVQPAEVIAARNEQVIREQAEMERKREQQLQNVINATSVDSRSFATHNHIMQPSASNPDPVLNRLVTQK